MNKNNINLESQVLYFSTASKNNEIFAKLGITTYMESSKPEIIDFYMPLQSIDLITCIQIYQEDGLLPTRIIDMNTEEKLSNVQLLFQEADVLNLIEDDYNGDSIIRGHAFYWAAEIIVKLNRRIDCGENLSKLPFQ